MKKMESDSVKFRDIMWEMTNYWAENKVDYRRIVSSFEVRKKWFKDEYEVTIFTSRPGIIIGQKGYLITGLQNVLKEEYNVYSVRIKEFDFWQNEYRDYMDFDLDNSDED